MEERAEAPGVDQAGEAPGLDQAEDGRLVRLSDAETGEVLGLARAAVHNPRAGARARQAGLVEAFVGDVWSKGGHVGFWTFGSGLVLGSDEVDRFCGWVERLTRVLDGRWILVLEAGTKSGHVHAHVLAEEFLEHSEMRAAWSRITGQKDPHVHVEAVRGSSASGLASYVSKRLSNYLRKGEEDVAWIGRRLFRSSKNLRRSCAAELERLKGGRPRRGVFVRVQLSETA